MWYAITEPLYCVQAHLRMAWNYITTYGKQEATPLIKSVLLTNAVRNYDGILYSNRTGIQHYIDSNIGKVSIAFHGHCMNSPQPSHLHSVDT